MIIRDTQPGGQRVFRRCSLIDSPDYVDSYEHCWWGPGWSRLFLFDDRSVAIVHDYNAAAIIRRYVGDAEFWTRPSRSRVDIHRRVPDRSSTITDARETSLIASVLLDPAPPWLTAVRRIYIFRDGTWSYGRREQTDGALRILTSPT